MGSIVETHPLGGWINTKGLEDILFTSSTGAAVRLLDRLQISGGPTTYTRCYTYVVV